MPQRPSTIITQQVLLARLLLATCRLIGALGANYVSRGVWPSIPDLGGAGARSLQAGLPCMRMRGFSSPRGQSELDREVPRQPKVGKGRASVIRSSYRRIATQPPPT